MRRLLVLLLLFLPLAHVHAETFLVLPFFNLSKSPNIDWIGESIGETIREALAGEGALALDRDDRQEAWRRLNIRPYAVLTKATVIKIGELLDADQVVFGQFELLSPEPNAARPQKSLRITAQILDLRRLRRGPEFSAIGALEDLAALQNHLAWQTIHLVLPKTAPDEEEFRRRRPPVRVDAVENYIRGLVATDIDQKHRFFTQAARLDSRFSQPCFQLGRLQLQKKNYREAADWLDRVSPTDVHYREAAFLKGICRYELSDFGGAETVFAQVAKDVPLNEVFNNLGAAQSRRNLPEAVQSFRKALEGDQADPVYHFNLGYALWKQGDFTAAADSFRGALERDPTDQMATTLLGRCLKQAGPRPGDSKMDGLERLKYNYEETAYQQLRALIESGKK
jgi:tetratricopeptide (TPR) repeat protein